MRGWGGYCGQHLSEAEMGREGSGDQRAHAIQGRRPCGLRPLVMVPSLSHTVSPRGSWERSSDALGTSQGMCARCAWADVWTFLARFASYLHSATLLHSVSNPTQRHLASCPLPVPPPTSSSFAGVGVLEEEGANSWCCISKYWQYTQTTNMFLCNNHACMWVCICICICICMPLDL